MLPQLEEAECNGHRISRELVSGTELCDTGSSLSDVS